MILNTRLEFILEKPVYTPYPPYIYCVCVCMYILYICIHIGRRHTNIHAHTNLRGKKEVDLNISKRKPSIWVKSSGLNST